jgi:hypothetical protein
MADDVTEKDGDEGVYKVVVKARVKYERSTRVKTSF